LKLFVFALAYDFRKQKVLHILLFPLRKWQKNNNYLENSQLCRIGLLTAGKLLCIYVLESFLYQILTSLDYGRRAETESLDWCDGDVAIYL